MGSIYSYFVPDSTTTTVSDSDTEDSKKVASEDTESSDESDTPSSDESETESDTPASSDSETESDTPAASSVSKSESNTPASSASEPEPKPKSDVLLKNFVVVNEIKILQTLMNTDGQSTCINIEAMKLYDNFNNPIDESLFKITPSSVLDNSQLNKKIPYTNCTHFPNFYMINLNKNMPISKLVLYNRQDCCKDTINGLIVMMFTVDETVYMSNPVSGTPNVVSFSPPNVVPLNES